MEEDNRSIGRKFASDIRSASKENKFTGFNQTHLLIMLGIFLGIFILGVVFYLLVQPLLSLIPKDLGFFTALVDMFRHHFVGTMMFIALDAAASYFIVYLIACKRPSYDRHGNKIDPSRIHGTSVEQTAEILNETYELTLPDDFRKGIRPEGIIVGQIQSGRREILSAPWSSEKPRRLLNQNIWITGMSGSGKTKYFLLMLIFQSALDEINKITTDPKGEMYSEGAAICLYKGEEIYLFNIDDLRNSDAVDILKFIRTSDTPEIMADALVEILLKASREKNGVGFFDDTNANLLYLACLYVARAKTFTPFEINNSPSEIMPAGYNPGDMGTGLQYYQHRTFDEVCRLITSVNGTDIHSMEERIRQSIERDPEDAELLRDAFNIWTGHAKTKDDTQSSTAVALKNIVQNKILRMILSRDEIDFNKVVTQHSSLFLVMPVGTSPYANVVSLISDFLMREIDKESKRNGGSLPIDHRLIFEELGAVPRQASLKVFVANCRSMGVGTVLCTQSLSQGTNLYPNGEFGDIIGNCALQICKTVQRNGVNQAAETADYFSARSGEYGAVERMSSYGSGMFGTLFKKGESERVSSSQVITRDDIYGLRVDECVLATASQKGAVILDSLFFKDHPAYKVKLKNRKTGKFEKPNAVNHIPKWRGGKSVNEELTELYEIVVLTDEEVEELKEREYQAYLKKSNKEIEFKVSFKDLI